MAGNLTEIGTRVKGLRDAEDVSVEALSLNIGVSIEDIAKYESGEVDIPISFLTKVAKYFNIEITELITGDKPKLSMYSICRKGKGVSVERFKEYKYNSLAYKFKNKKCEPYEVTVHPEDNKPLYMNSHSGHEFDFVLKGKVKMVIEDQEVILNEGDCIYLDSQYKHALKAVDGDATFLAIVLP